MMETKMSRTYYLFWIALFESVKDKPRGWQRELAEFVSVDPSHISQIYSRDVKKKASTKLQEQIASWLGFNSLFDMLDFGKTLVRKKETRIVSMQSELSTVFDNKITNKEQNESILFTQVPYFSSKLLQSEDNANNNGGILSPLAFRTDWLLEKGTPNNMVIARATGNCMHPLIYDGDLVLIDTSQRDLIQGKIYAIYFNDELHIKRTEIVFDTPRNENQKFLPILDLILQSENQQFEDIIINLKKDIFKLVGRVVWIGRDISSA